MRTRSSLVLLPLGVAAAPCSGVLKRSTTDPAALSGQTFDFVIVGGGTSGLALAGRLAEWSNITVAVIEAGSDGTDVADQIQIPGMCYLNGLAGTSNDWGYHTTIQTSAGSISKSWPRGKVLGGSSAINGMFWGRASEAEYDAWNTLQSGASGAEDWGWNTMQAAMKKSETYTPMPDADAATFSVTHDLNSHGTSGPIHASYSSYQFSQLSTWIPTMVAMGLPHALDPANGTNHGVSFTTSTLNPANGSRSDSNFGYITPYAQSNLVVLTGYQVTKINWNSTTSGNAVAGGVSFAANAQGQVYTVNAAKEVILSGGTIGSPQLLQLSGVGPKDVITAVGIDSVVDLPGVGANVQDHLSAPVYMQATDNDTWAALKDTTLWNEQLDIWRANGTGMWTYVNEATAYASLSDLMGSNASSWISSLDTTSALSTVVSAASMDSTVEAGVKAQYAILQQWASLASLGQVELIFNMFGSGPGFIGMQFCLQHPFSRGTIHINSSSAFDYPEINPNYLSVSYDLDIMRAALKYVRSIIATAPMSALIVAETAPGTSITADADIDSYIATNSGTEYHPIGSNSMLPKEYGGVVNTSLVVYGTANVRVVDASVVPMQISAHTMQAAFAVAERGADLIKATYGAVLSSDNSTSGDSSNSDPSKNNDSTNSPSALSTTTKIAIGAGAAVAAIALLSLFMLLSRRRKNKLRTLPAAPAGHDKQEVLPWNAEDYYRGHMQPPAPFVAVPGSERDSGSFSVHSLGHPQQVHYSGGRYYDNPDVGSMISGGHPAYSSPATSSHFQRRYAYSSPTDTPWLSTPQHTHGDLHSDVPHAETETATLHSPSSPPAFYRHPH